MKKINYIYSYSFYITRYGDIILFLQESWILIIGINNINI